MAVISNLVTNLKNAANGNTTGFFNFNNTPQQSSTAAFPFTGRTANTPVNIAYGGSPTVPTGGPTNTQPAMTFKVPQTIPPTIANPNAGGGTTAPTYSGFNMINGQPISATNPQATQDQLNANLTKQNQNQNQQQQNQNQDQQQQNQTGSIPSTFSTLINAQGNTTPPAGTTGAIGSLAGIGTGLNLTPQQQQNIQNINQGAQVSGNIAQNQTPAVTAAQNAYNQFSANNPLLQAGFMNNPNLTAAVAAGRGQILGNQLAGEQQGLAQNVANALQGQGQQLTGAEQQGQLGLGAVGTQLTGAQQAGTLANVAQANQITAQQNAASNLLNSLTQQGYVIINKTTGQPLSPQGAAQAAFSGGQTGAAETAGGNTFLMNQANTAAKGIQGTIQQFLESNSDINQFPLTLANAAQQWLQGTQIADPRYQTLFNYLNEYTNTLAPLLGVGGSPTNLKTEIAQSFINPKASGQSISQVLESIGQLADQKLANLISAGQGGGQVAGGTPTGSTPTSFGQEW